MNSRFLLSCTAAAAFAITASAENPDKRSDGPPRPDSQPPAPLRHQNDAPSKPRDSGRREGPANDPRARLGHLIEAIEHLRAAGLNEPAENLQKTAHEMRGHLERERREISDGKSPEKSQSDTRERRESGHRNSSSPESHRPFGPPMDRLEEMQKQIRTLSSQVQDLRNMMQKRGGDQQPSARSEGPREGDRRVGNADGPPRRPDGPPNADQHSRDGDRRHVGDRDGAARDKPPGEARNQSRPEDAKRDAPPRDGAGKTPQPDAPRDGAKEGARAESSSSVRRPSEEDRGRFMGLSDQGRERFLKEMREGRDKLTNSSPEERMKWAKGVFERIEAEDKVKKDESGSADDALRALQVKPPF